jgi:hypothetical protein
LVHHRQAPHHWYCPAPRSCPPIDFRRPGWRSAECRRT